MLSIFTLNYFLGRLPISSSFTCFCGFLSWSFVWNIFFCFIFSKFLCLWSHFLRLQDCSSFYFWYLHLGGWSWYSCLWGMHIGRHCCLPTGGWSWVLALWRAGLSRGMSGYSCGLRKSLGSLSADELDCFPAQLVMWAEASQHLVPRGFWEGQVLALVSQDGSHQQQ